MEMNPPFPEKGQPFPTKPYTDAHDTLMIPLTGDRWELICTMDGKVHIACVMEPVEPNEPISRWIMTLGKLSKHIEAHEDMIEGFNYIKSRGQSTSDPN